MNPKVTVLMPVYNGEAFLRHAIDSILAQTYTDFEFLILNDYSTDSSTAIISSYTDPRIKLINNTGRKGLASVLNLGLNLAAGTYAARMDCDDISLPDRLEKQVAFLEANPDISIIGSGYETIGNQIKRYWQGPSDHESVKATLFFHPPVAHPTVMMKLADIRQHSLFYDPDFFIEDWNLWIRAGKAVQINNIPDILLQYRVVHASMSRSQAHISRRAECEQKIIKQNLADMGLSFSPEDLTLFSDIFSKRKPLDKTNLIFAKQCIYQIIEANQKTQIYNDAIFINLITVYWYRLISNSFLHGLTAIKAYRQFKFSSYFPLTLKMKIMILMKSILQWRRIRKYIIPHL